VVREPIALYHGMLTIASKPKACSPGARRPAIYPGGGRRGGWARHRMRPLGAPARAV